MSSRTDLLLWAQRILAMTASPPHVLLEIQLEASIPEAQEAFHKIARTSHPDLHRAGLSADELELVTLAYSRVAGAYQDFRSQRLKANRMRPLGDAPTFPSPDAATGSPRSRTDTSSPARSAPTTDAPRSRTDTSSPARSASTTGAPRSRTDTSSPAGSVPTAAQVTGGAGGSGAMNSKALIYYRKAELALRRGDLKGALLQMKMAIAGDPQSALLRSALAEIEAELGKPP